MSAPLSGAGLGPAVPAFAPARPIRRTPARLLVVFWIALAIVQGAPKKPVYIGARDCAKCHSSQSIGNQYGKWLHSKHSQAWTALARPEAKEIAKVSGLRVEPQQSAICLGCHATAANAEEWERDDDFRIEDGVQCERCHGPGSEYATEEIMRDKNAAMKAGLLMPDETTCRNCHIEKGSHTAVLTRPPHAGYEKARQEIAHPMPKGPHTSGGVPEAAPPQAGPKFAGSYACGKCHRGPAMGHQYSIWLRSPHARAWATLATPKAQEIATKNNIADATRAPECLKCHATAARPDEGVGCESCHGAGSDYMADAVMRDPRAAKAAGLKPVTRETCARCHVDKAFDFEAAKKKIAHPAKLPPVAVEPRYKTPLNMAVLPDGKELYVSCEASDSVVVVDLQTRQKVAEIAVGGNPADVSFSPDGKLAFASNRYSDTVSVIDVATRKIASTLKVGSEPHGVLTDKEGKRLYVLNTSSNDITVFDIASMQRVKNLSASNGPWSLARSPDGGMILATNSRSKFAPVREPFDSEVTAIETERGAVENRMKVPGANLMMGIDWHPSGKFALATLNRTKNHVPMTRLVQGWTITNGLAVLWRDGRVDEVLLDEPGMGFADATDVACTPDGRYALVTSSGTDRVAVVDVNKLTGMLSRATRNEREQVIPNHLGKSAEFIVKHIPTRSSPRGVVVTPDGKSAFVANSIDDSLTEIDLAKLEPAGRIDLGGPKEMTKARIGEKLFHSANITFRKQFACHSCHPDGHVDGLAYDIEADGIGVSPVDNRTLRGILDTAPFKWEGTNPSLQRQCGARLSVFFTRVAPFTPEQLSMLDYYITTIERPPNRYRPLGAKLSPAQRRGKEMFERTTTNDRRVIPTELRCSSCHYIPYGTDRRVHDVGTKHAADRTGKFDVPHLNNIYDSAPYLHNGMAATLEEIWTVYNPDDKHGVTNDMTKDQLNDLIEYIKTL